MIMDHRTYKHLVQEAMKHLIAFCSTLTLYPAEHPHTKQQIEQAQTALQAVWQHLPELSVDIQEGLFLIDGIPLYELTLQSEKITPLFKTRAIKNITLRAAVSPGDLLQFGLLLTQKNATLSTPAVFQESLRQAGITAITVAADSRYNDALADAEQTPLAAGKKIYGSGVEATKLVYAALRQGHSFPLDVVDNVAESIADFIARDPHAGLALANLRDYDEYTFTHSTNVAILSVATASGIIADPQSIKLLARAAMLHDIGKTRIPLEIINKPGKLSDAEWLIMQEHPRLGAMLLRDQPSIDRLSLLIAFQHHMKYDLTGYPRLAGLSALHPFSLIVNICDIYDAMTSKRPYKPPLAPDKALAIMMRLIGCDFEPQLFKLFVQIMGVYPPGVFIRLNTGEIALTRRTRPQQLLQPIVSILTTAGGELLNEPITIDLSEKTENIRNRSIAGTVDAAAEGLNPLDFI